MRVALVHLTMLASALHCSEFFVWIWTWMVWK